MGNPEQEQNSTLTSIQLLLRQASVLADEADCDVLKYLIAVAELECEKTLSETASRNLSSDG